MSAEIHFVGPQLPQFRQIFKAAL